MSSIPPAQRIELSPAVRAILDAGGPKSRFLQRFLHIPVSSQREKSEAFPVAAPPSISSKGSLPRLRFRHIVKVRSLMLSRWPPPFYLFANGGREAFDSGTFVESLPQRIEIPRPPYSSRPSARYPIPSSSGSSWFAYWFISHWQYMLRLYCSRSISRSSSCLPTSAKSVFSRPNLSITRAAIRSGLYSQYRRHS